MATTNPTVTTAWTKIVAVGQDFLLTLPFDSATSVEVATTDADSAPVDIKGHILSGDQQEGMNRPLIGPGYVWAKAAGSLPVVLNNWAP